MKAVAIILVIVCLAAFAGVGYLYMSANLVVEACGVVAADAVDQPDYFASLQAGLQNGTFMGTRFVSDTPKNAEDCVFYTYTVRLKNNCFLPAEVVELQVTPRDGDMLQIGVQEEKSIPARGRGELSATILTKKGGHNVRELKITCYFWGLPFTIRTAWGS